jgi:uncharacterized protein YjbI with pentapeptide repeats
MSAVKANFDEAVFNMCNFSQANLAAASFINAWITNSVAENAQLDAANFTNARLDYTNFSNSSTKKTDFNRAILFYVNLHGTQDAKLNNAEKLSTVFKTDPELYAAQNWVPLKKLPR